jgi:hypothetical protein
MNNNNAGGGIMLHLYIINPAELRPEPQPAVKQRGRSYLAVARLCFGVVLAVDAFYALYTLAGAL